MNLELSFLVSDQYLQEYINFAVESSTNMNLIVLKVLIGCNNSFQT